MQSFPLLTYVKAHKNSFFLHFFLNFKKDSAVFFLCGRYSQWSICGWIIIVKCIIFQFEDVWSDLQRGNESSVGCLLPWFLSDSASCGVDLCPLWYYRALLPFTPPPLYYILPVTPKQALSHHLVDRNIITCKDIQYNDTGLVRVHDTGDMIRFDPIKFLTGQINRYIY